LVSRALKNERFSFGDWSHDNPRHENQKQSTRGKLLETLEEDATSSGTSIEPESEKLAGGFGNSFTGRRTVLGGDAVKKTKELSTERVEFQAGAKKCNFGTVERNQTQEGNRLHRKRGEGRTGGSGKARRNGRVSQTDGRGVVGTTADRGISARPVTGTIVGGNVTQGVLSPAT